MKTKGLLLFIICMTVNVQAQIRMDSISIFINPNSDIITASEPNVNGEIDTFKNSLGTDVDIFISKRFLIFWNKRRGAFSGANGNLISKLPNGQTLNIQDFELGDNVIINIPQSYFDGKKKGVKAVFGHAIEADQVAILMNNDDSVEMVFEITGISDQEMVHINGHICDPLDTECK